MCAISLVPRLCLCKLKLGCMGISLGTRLVVIIRVPNQAIIGHAS